MPVRRHPRRHEDAVIAGLRARIAAIEGAHPAPGGDGVLRLGAPEVDGALPWRGLKRAALHEIIARDAGAGAGFAAALLARLAGAHTSVLWCASARALTEGGGPYAPGLLDVGLDPARLIVARGRNDRESLWAMEEGLRTSRLAAVLGEVAALDLTQSRRLQRAAEQSGTTALLLRPAGAERAPSAAFTRWRLEAAASAAEAGGGVGAPRWRADLVRCRGGAPRTWTLEWRNGAWQGGTWRNEEGHDDGQDGKAGGFAVAADLPHRPGHAPAAATGGGARRRTGAAA